MQKRKTEQASFPWLKNKKKQEELTLKEILNSPDIPYWWQIDIPVGLDEKETKKLNENIARTKESVLTQIAELEDVKNVNAKALEADREEFTRLREEQDLRNREKEEELRLFEQRSIAEREAELIAKQRELEEIKRERALLAQNIEIARREVKIKAESEREQQAIMDIVQSVTREIHAERKETELLDAEYKRLSEERESLYPMEEKIKSYAGEYFAKKYESFNTDNILEIVDVCLFDKDSRKYVLRTPIIGVKKDTVTVVCTDEYRQELLIRILHRNLPSHLNVCSGEIRLEGENVSSMYRDDYNKKFQGKITSFINVREQLAKSERNFYDTLKVSKTDANFAYWTDVLNIDKDLLNKKAKNLFDVDLDYLALCYLMSLKQGLIILEEPFLHLSKEQTDNCMAAINANTVMATLLVLTADKKTALDFYDAKFYIF